MIATGVPRRSEPSDVARNVPVHRIAQRHGIEHLLVYYWKVESNCSIKSD